MNKVAVLGTGYVGLTTGIGLANFGASVVCLDIDEQKIDRLNRGILPFYEPGLSELLHENREQARIRFSSDIAEGIHWADIIFICVGTPAGADGKPDLSAILECAETIGKNIRNYKIIVTKSTVPVGTNEQIRTRITSLVSKELIFDVVSNPEFLREGRAVYDFLNPDRVVIGVESDRPVESIKKIYRPLYLNEIPFIITDLKTAEMIKYSANCFLAAKVAFINEISRLCDIVGAEVQTVASVMGKDARIGQKFLSPGPGFGGSCFPKDVLALAETAKELKVIAPVIGAIMESNDEQKKYVFAKIRQKYSDMKNVTIAILGLSFKANTDDMRESPAIVLIDELLRVGARVKVYDPQAMPSAKVIWGDKIAYCENEYDAANEVNGVAILTEWSQFKNLDLKRIACSMKDVFFFDFRNIYARKEVEEYGFDYVGIGA